MQRNCDLRGKNTKPTFFHILVCIPWGWKCLGLRGSFSHPVPEQLAVEYSLLCGVWLLTELLSRIPGDQLWKCGRSEAELVKQQPLGIEQ